MLFNDELPVILVDEKVVCRIEVDEGKIRRAVDAAQEKRNSDNL